MPFSQVSFKKVQSKKNTTKKTTNGQLLLSGSLKRELPWETVGMAMRWVTFH